MTKKPCLARPSKKASGQIVSCAPRPMTSSSAGSLLAPAVSYSISYAVACVHATLPRPPCCVQHRRQPCDGLAGGAQGRVLRGIGGAGIVCNRRPRSCILDVAAKFLEAEAAVGTSEEI